MENFTQNTGDDLQTSRVVDPDPDPMTFEDPHLDPRSIK
jgi:hypothetical protein